ncbi:DUF1173 family protein [Roseateles sp.]|uniref:DUF1173 family protein n=1 Tax=Roseateles sp. TaxID=1971397 RepID=UPI003D14AB3B
MHAETQRKDTNQTKPEPTNGDIGWHAGRFLVGRQEIGASDPGFAQAIRDAHESHQRPRCLCTPEGVEMYIARYGSDHIVKRMPDTGHCHASQCSSFEPPASWSGLAPLIGHAIREDPRTGETQLNVDFSLSQRAARQGNSDAHCDARESSAASSAGATRMSLGCLLQYLWDQAELTRWHAGFAGKRTWSTVRRMLLHAAEFKQVRGQALLTHLFIPESFSVERREEIDARRLAHWNQLRRARRPRPLMLLIAELKDLMPGRFGYQAVVKHMPDQAWVLQEPLFRRLERRFQTELTLWSSSPELRQLMIGAFWVSEAGVPTLESLSLMPVTPEWLPVEDRQDLHLLHELLTARRSFIKSQRYRLPRTAPSASAILTDTGRSPIPLYIDRSTSQDQPSALGCTGTTLHGGSDGWCWRLSSGTMPTLPSANPCFRQT